MINIFSKTIKFEERENYVTWSDQELDASRNSAVDAMYVSLDEPGAQCTDSDSLQFR